MCSSSRRRINPEPRVPSRPANASSAVQERLRTGRLNARIPSLWSRGQESLRRSLLPERSYGTKPRRVRGEFEFLETLVRLLERWATKRFVLYPTDKQRHSFLQFLATSYTQRLLSFHRNEKRDPNPRKPNASRSCFHGQEPWQGRPCLLFLEGRGIL